MAWSGTLLVQIISSSRRPSYQSTELRSRELFAYLTTRGQPFWGKVVIVLVDSAVLLQSHVTEGVRSCVEFHPISGRSLSRRW